MSLGPATLSATSVPRSLAVLTALLLLRHGLVPRPSIIDGLRLRTETLQRIVRGPAWRAAAPLWLATRSVVLTVGFLAVAAVGVPEPARGLRTYASPVLDLGARWDAQWYLGIATNGYRWLPDTPGRQQNVAFFPGYPLLMRTGGAILGARPDLPLHRPAREERLRTRTLIAGWLISLAAFFCALCALYRWAARAAGAGVAGRSVLLLSTFPFAVYFSAPYTESLFLLASLASFNAMDARRPLSAGTWGAVAGLLRPNGFLLALPMAMLAMRNGARGGWIASAMPVAGVAAYSAFLWSLTGHPFTWAAAHAAWGRTAPTLGGTVARPAQKLMDEGLLGYAASAPLDVLNGAAVVFAVALLPVVWRRLGPAPTLLVVANLAPPLLTGGLMSIGRLVSTLFPLFVGLALVVRPRHASAWAAVFMALQALAAVLFFTWRPLV